jgi:hypothetical protein
MAVDRVRREPFSAGYQGKSISDLHRLGGVNAVLREPLSIHKFPLTGKFTGNFCIFGLGFLPFLQISC